MLTSRRELTDGKTKTFARLQFLMGVFRLEIVTTYFSDAVVGGFSTGAACHVFVTQLKDFFGLKNIKTYGGPLKLFKARACERAPPP